jgi:hypothetical protein
MPLMQTPAFALIRARRIASSYCGMMVFNYPNLRQQLSFASTACARYILEFDFGSTRARVQFNKSGASSSPQTFQKEIAGD